MHRRRFLQGSACAAGAALGPSRASTLPRLTIDQSAAVGTIAPDFIGLSYETAQLSNPDFFSAENNELVAFVRLLGTAGVLRIGGNTSAFSVWSPDGAPPSGEAFGPDTGRNAAPRRPVTPAAIRSLRSFLDATGWTLIYGLNMGGGTSEAASDEASFVMRTMEHKLIAFQLCNEPDLFHRNALRDADYNYARFAVEWQRTHDAVRARVPDAPFAGPDTAYNNDWLVPFAQQFRGEVTFLSQHYYAEGPPTDPSMTIERLLRPDPKLKEEFDGMDRTRRDTGLPFRLAETNSCWGGGKQGVSDTFASALWGGELMYKLALAGGAGINFHGGGNGWYTPIAGTAKTGFSARPLYYAMLMFARAGAGTLLRAGIDGRQDDLVSAFALRSADGGLKSLLFNKSADRDVDLQIGPDLQAAVLRLRAPRLQSTDRITLGDSHVGPHAAWPGRADEELRIGTIHLPRASAALVSFSRQPS